MSVRVGRIMRHEDVHGVSGTGDHLADVFEASDGTTIVRWLGKDGSTNVYQGVKNVSNVHGHGGKTEIEWLWEQEADADPMEAVFDKKIEEAGGTLGPTAAKEEKEAEAEAEAEEIAEALVEEAAETVDRVAVKLAEKLLEKTAEKSAENAARALPKCVMDCANTFRGGTLHAPGCPELTRERNSQRKQIPTDAKVQEEPTEE